MKDQAAATGYVHIENAVRIKVLKIRRHGWLLRPSMLVEWTCANDVPTQQWLIVGDVLCSHLDVRLQEAK